MDRFLLEHLNCPYCGGGFSESGVDHTSNRMNYGVLTCSCSQFPVVAGIPVLKRDHNVEKAIAFIEADRHVDAVLTLIEPPSIRMPLIWNCSSYLPLGSRMRRWAHAKRMQEWQKGMAAVLLCLDQGKQIRTCDLLAAYHTNEENYNYFAFRFGQPRYLVALSLVSLIREPKKMVLDLGCGYGHITRSLVYQTNDRPVIGIDPSFWGLYVAKHCIAPKANYICCSGDNALPFVSRSFSVVFSSDAFHYVTNKRVCIQEIKRITEELIILARNKTGRVSYEEAPVPQPEAYRMLLGDLSHRIVSDEDLLERYFRKEGPDLSARMDTALLRTTRFLSIVASQQEDIFRCHGRFDQMPHAKGRLIINPIYKLQAGNDSGKIRLLRSFLSPFYEKQHPEYKKFMPERIELDSTILDDLENEKRTPVIEQLIEQYIVLGVPDNYSSHQSFPSVVSTQSSV